MGNVDTHRAVHAAFDRRDLKGAVRSFAQNAEYVNHPRGITLKGPEEFVDYLQEWIDGFSDASPLDARFLDAGDHTIALFTATGTNDGAIGPLKATGNRLHMPLCEILRYDNDGQIIGGEVFYDLATLMVQLGHGAGSAEQRQANPGRRP